MRTPTVLVVDDVVEIVDELLTLMRLHKIAAVGALDLDSAIAALRREPGIRAISCDVRLDRETGLDIVDRIKNDPVLHTRDLRYLFVSGDQMELNRHSYGSNFATLSKPVQPAILIDTIKRMLDMADA